MRDQLLVLLGAAAAVHGVNAVPASSPASPADRQMVRPHASGPVAQWSPFSSPMSRRGILPFLSKDKSESPEPAAPVTPTTPPPGSKDAPAPATPPPPPPPPPSNPPPTPTVPVGSSPSSDVPPPKTSNPPEPTNPKNDATSIDSSASPARNENAGSSGTAADDAAAAGSANTQPASTSTKSGMSTGTIYGVVLGGLAALVGLLAFIHRWKSSRERHQRKAALPPAQNKPSPEFRLKPKDEQAEKVVGSTLPRAHSATAAHVAAFTPAPVSTPRVSYAAAAPFAYAELPPSSPFRARPSAPAALVVTNETDQVQYLGEDDATDYLLDHGAPSPTSPASRVVGPREYAGSAPAAAPGGGAYVGLYPPQYGPPPPPPDGRRSGRPSAGSVSGNPRDVRYSQTSHGAAYGSPVLVASGYGHPPARTSPYQ